MLDNSTELVGTSAPKVSPPLVTLWLSFFVVIFVAAFLDVCYISRAEPGGSCWRKAYVKQIIFWIFAGFFFNFLVMLILGMAAAGNWSYGYFLEYMLSVDNLFVFQLVFKSYACPEGQHVERALFWGISAAILLRLAFFGVGTSLLAMGFISRPVNLDHEPSRIYSLMLPWRWNFHHL